MLPALIILAAAASVALANNVHNGKAHRKPFVFDPEHTYTAEEAIECGLPFAEIDGEPGISVAEAERLRHLALGTGAALKLLAANAINAATGVFGIKTRFNAISVQQVFADCDTNKDNVIDFDDFVADRKKEHPTCLETPGKIRDAIQFICKQGAEGVFN